MIDVLERRVVRTVDLAAYARPHGIDFLPGDSLVAVTSEGTGNVVIVRVANGRVVQALATGQGGSHMLGIVGDGSRIYTSNMSGNTVSELDVEHGGRTRLFSVPPTPEAITVSSDGSEVWVGSNDHGTVSVVSTVDGSVETPLSGFGWPYRILLVPQRGLVVIPDLRANQVRIVERASRSELVRLEFPGGSPQGVTVTPDGRWLFLSLSGQDRVAMIDLLAREVVKYIATGSGPDGIGWSPLESGGADAAELAPSPVPVVEALAGDVALVGGRLFDGLGDALRANPGILVRNGVIVQVGYDPAEIGAESVRIVPLDDDQTVLPGLFDVHAHYGVDLFGEGRVDEYEVNPSVFLANGVTSTFPGGEVDPEGMLEARREIDAGLRPGPRIFNSGPYFGTARPGWRAELMSADSIRSEVDYWAARGASGFKAKGIAPQHLAPLIDQAHLHGLPVNGHLDSGMSDSVNPADAIAMGIDRIEHFLGGAALPAERSAYASLEALELSDPRTSSEMRDVARLYVEHGVFFDATLTAYGYFAPDVDPTMYERWFDEMALLTPYARHAVESRLPRIRSDQFARIYEVKLSTVKAFYDAGGGPWLTLGKTTRAGASTSPGSARTGSWPPWSRPGSRPLRRCGPPPSTVHVHSARPTTSEPSRPGNTPTSSWWMAIPWPTSGPPARWSR